MPAVCDLAASPQNGVEIGVPEQIMVACVHMLRVLLLMALLIKLVLSTPNSTMSPTWGIHLCAVGCLAE
jgi:hypothetical protein